VPMREDEPSSGADVERVLPFRRATWPVSVPRCAFGSLTRTAAAYGYHERSPPWCLFSTSCARRLPLQTPVYRSRSHHWTALHSGACGFGALASSGNPLRSPPLANLPDCPLCSASQSTLLSHPTPSRAFLSHPSPTGTNRSRSNRYYRRHTLIGACIGTISPARQMLQHSAARFPRSATRCDTAQHVAAKYNVLQPSHRSTSTPSPGVLR
jgi:hypothetical protein